MADKYLARVRRAAEQAALAHAERDAAIRAAVEAGCSLRQVGRAANLSHVRVIQITRQRD